jgi:CheY-like chemotaxis protein
MAMRVLIVDDEAFIRDLIRDTLRVRRYETESASHGAEALERLARPGIDIVITDVVMPGMSGLDFVRQVRRLHPNLRIVVLTGFPRSADIGDFLAQGVDDFLPKPFRANDLLGILKRVEARIAATSGSGTPEGALDG